MKKMVIDGQEIEYATVADVISELSELDPDLLVIIAKDPEGNGYSPYSGYNDEMYYDPNSTWSGEMVDPDEQDGESEADAPFYYDEEERERIKNLPKALVLWPIN